MSNKLYDFIKVSTLIIIPFVAALIGTLGETWGWENADKIVITINAIATCIGGIITKLSIDYAKKRRINSNERR